MWLSMQFAWIRLACSNIKIGPCVTSSVIKEKFYDSCTFDYTRLVTHLHSSTFVCVSSTFVYTSLHSSSDLPVFLE